MARKAMGAGLDTLIPKTNVEGTENKNKEIIKESNTIDINKIEPNSSQPRKTFNEDSLQELAESIKMHGLIEPLIVKKAKKGFFTIIAGERRWRASILAQKNLVWKNRRNLLQGILAVNIACIFQRHL